MKYALFSVPVGTIYDLPQTIKEGEEGLVSTIGDEGLYGQACQVRTAPGGVTAAGVRLPPDVAEVVSFYGYHGYVDQRELQFVREEELWEYLGADLVLVGRAADVLSLPKVQGVRMMELERGGVLRRQPETAEEAEAHKGWAKVLLTDGRTGYVRDVALEPVKYEMTAVFSQREGLAFNDALAETLNTTADKLVPEAVARWYGGSEEAFRAAVCEQAKKYMGTEYRWGGKSGRGIDCSGLVSSAYMQCGVLIYRDAKIIEGWPMHEVAFENKKPGDALFFPGHVALYLGEGRYIHSTGAAVSGGVAIGLLATLPLAQASGMGLNAYFVYTVVLGLGFSYANALVLVLFDGILFILLTVTGLRKLIFQAIPQAVRVAIPAGIGLFIAFLGLQNAGIIIPSASTASHWRPSTCSRMAGTWASWRWL